MIFDAKKESQWGLVYERPQRIEILKRHGYLAQFHSTQNQYLGPQNVFLPST